MNDFALPFPPELIDAIAQRAAEVVLAGIEVRERSPYLTIPEAADHIRCKPQRIRDLLSQRRLTTYKDGSRTLVLRAELEAHVAGELVGPVAQLSPTVSRSRSGRAAAA